MATACSSTPRPSLERPNRRRRPLRAVRARVAARRGRARLIAYQVIHGASPAISKFGFGFLTDSTWEPNNDKFGAGTVIFGTIVSSVMALCIATPLGIAIGLYLALLTSSKVRAIVGPLVEMLAAIPSVILGFWGILILAPFIQGHLEPWLHHHAGFIPVFGDPQTTGLACSRRA